VEDHWQQLRALLGKVMLVVEGTQVVTGAVVVVQVAMLLMQAITVVLGHAVDSVLIVV
jgi:hypothetical protein